MKKFPKQPLAKSSLAVWQRYEKKCAEVAAYNKAIKAAPAKKDAIRNKVRNLKNKI